MDNKELIAKTLDRPALTRMGHRQQLELAESLAHALEAAEAELTRRDTVIVAVREIRDQHPACDRHDEDDPVSCGWKRVVQDIDAALDAAPVSLEAVKAETTTDADTPPRNDGWGMGQVLRAAGGSTGQTSSSADWAGISKRVTGRRHPVETEGDNRG